MVENVKSPLTDRKLICMVVMACLFVTALQIASEVLKPMKTQQTVFVTPHLVTTMKHCAFPTDRPLVIACLAFLIIIIVWTAWLAYTVSGVPTNYNESKELALTLYTCILLSGFMLPLADWMWSNQEYDGFYGVVGLYLSTLPLFMIILLFGKRVYIVLANVTLDNSRTSASDASKTTPRVEGSLSLSSLIRGAQSCDEVRPQAGGTSKTKTKQTDGGLFSGVVLAVRIQQCNWHRSDRASSECRRGSQPRGHECTAIGQW